MSRKREECSGRPVISGVFLLGLGLYLLGMSYDWIPDLSTSWPLLIVIVGVALIVKAFFREEKPKETSDNQPYTN